MIFYEKITANWAFLLHLMNYQISVHYSNIQKMNDSSWKPNPSVMLENKSKFYLTGSTHY